MKTTTIFNKSLPILHNEYLLASAGIFFEPMKKSVFLSAQWRKLAMANYVVDPEVLQPFVPQHTELDLWNGCCYVSLVGFRFIDTRLKGIPIPFHRHFTEVNLRFYVRYRDGEEWKRGVVFIQEIVPKPMLSFVARTVYGEPYATLPMDYKWEEREGNLFVNYSWKKDGKWHSFDMKTASTAVPIQSESEEQFITEHYWGYTARKNGQTSEYGVEHPTWDIYPVTEYSINVDFGLVYGEHFRFLNDCNPQSVLLAEGSEILVRGGRRLPHHH